MGYGERAGGRKAESPNADVSKRKKENSTEEIAVTRVKKSAAVRLQCGIGSAAEMISIAAK
jgi:hypothetical protein